MKPIVDMVTSFRINNNLRLACSITENIMGNRGVRFDVFKNIHDSLIKLSEESVVENMGYLNVIDCFYEDLIRHRHIVGKKPEITKREPILKVDTSCSKRTGARLRYILTKSTVLESHNPSDPLFVRLQQVWNFSYKGIFLFKLKKTVEAETKQDACKKAPQFEISIIMMRKTTYLNSHDDDYITKSFISKAMRLIGKDSTVSTLLDLEK
jgi:hypothetical protein